MSYSCNRCFIGIKQCYDTATHDVQPDIENSTLADPKATVLYGSTPSIESKYNFSWASILWLFSPGMWLQFASTDAGTVTSSAESGARWKYSTILPLIVAIPAFFYAQDLTIRLGVHTGKGLTTMLIEYCGFIFAGINVLLLDISCTSIIMTEMGCLATVGQMWGMSRLVGTLIGTALICLLVCVCSYRNIEALGILFACSSLLGVVVLCMEHPPVGEVFAGMFQFPSASGFWLLNAANCSIVSFGLYFQQTAVIATRIDKNGIPLERVNTLLGSIGSTFTQICLIVTFAAARHVENVSDATQMAQVLEPTLGALGAKIILTIILVGTALGYVFTPMLAAAWSTCEVLGVNAVFSLEKRPSEEPIFYGILVVVTGIGFAVIASGVNIVALNVYQQAMNGIFAIVTIILLLIFNCSDQLPEEARLTGFFKWSLIVGFSVLLSLELISIIVGFS